VWNAQFLDCEPYWAVLEPKQCFKCWKWGHIQRYCPKPALCGRCGARAHGEGGKAGEAQCPTHSGQLAFRCPCCGGRHPAWAKECPGKVRAKEEAREAYQYRPRAYAEPVRPGKPTQRIFSLIHDDEEGFQQVGAKRPRTLARGRPTGLSIASRDPSQSRITLGPISLLTSSAQPSQPSSQTPQAPVQSQQEEDDTMADDN
jgi:hypothetical protein